MRSKFFLGGAAIIVAAAAAIAYFYFDVTAPEPTIVVAKQEDEPDPVAVARIPPGTKIDVDAPPERSRVVFRSRPQVTSGEATKIGKAILDALQTFTTLVLVQAEPDPERPGQFRRGPFSIGIGMPGDKEDTVITRATADKHGVSLGFFEGKVLAEREKELNTVVSPGSTPTMAMFDFSSHHLRDDRRVQIVLRYAALVDPADGNIQTVHWILDVTPERYRYVEGSAKLLPPNHKMDWEMHVDGAKVSFGAPKSDAFAVTKLPQGTPVAVPDEVKPQLTARGYTAESAARLEQSLRSALNGR